MAANENVKARNSENGREQRQWRKPLGKSVMAAQHQLAAIAMAAA